MKKSASYLTMTLVLFAESLFAAPMAGAKPVVSEPTYGQATPEEARAALNRQQALDAQRQLADDAANLNAYHAAELAREDQIKSDQAAWEAEKARLASEYATAMEHWREDVAACRSGDRSRCRHR